MLDRAHVVHENFVKRVKAGEFPAARVAITPAEAGLSAADFLDLFDSQLKSRHLDLMARQLKEQARGFYTIGSSGHEGNAAVAKAFRMDDWAFLHYRSGAFKIQRAKYLPACDPVTDQLLSLMASSKDPISAGRHKVFGSVPLCIPPQTSTIASHLPKAVGAAFSITRAKELNIPSNMPADSVILCSFGDASANHSTAQGAFNAARWIAYSRYPLPLVFICEDNGIGISVKTPQNWIADTFTDRQPIQYISADGLHLADVYRAAKEAADTARQKKQPVFLHLHLVRLLGHAGSDIESQYQTEAAIEANEFQDPLLHSARIILEQGYLTADEIIERYKAVEQQVQTRAEQLATTPKLTSASEIMASIIPPKDKEVAAVPIDESKRKAIFADVYPQLNMPRNLCQNINFALTDIMLAQPNVVVFGEDVGKKGGVYRVTANLQERFGQRRVFDTLLDEQTILGTAIGMAQNRFLPIPEIQFLAYLHNAEDQLRGEAATLSFFSNGQFVNPLVIRIAGLAYQKGFGGHFHNDNSFAVIRDIPGVILACPSNGGDAAKMLRSCVALAQYENRVVVFLEPIALYMTKDLHQAGDNGWLFNYPKPDETIALGEIGIFGMSDELTILSFGNGYYLSRQAAKVLTDKFGVAVKVVDLRWLAPLNEAAIVNAVAGCKRVLIVDESRKTGSISEALMTLLLEQCHPLPTLKRITGHDSFIPLGDAWKYILPSKEDIIDVATELLGKSVSTKRAPPKQMDYQQGK